MDFIVGTFNSSELYTLNFRPPTAGSEATLDITHKSSALGKHSWFALSTDKKILYATAWTEPPSIASYSIRNSGRQIDYLNAKKVKSRSGYVCCSKTHIYSAGGTNGEALRLESDGSIGELVQEMTFLDDDGEGAESTAGDTHGAFGGLRHGAHSIDPSPDGRALYVADGGRNCIWTYAINDTSSGQHLKFGSKHVAPRGNDGPRHTWPHPNYKVLYSLQEHSSMVDVFSVADDGTTLKHVSGVKIIPAEKDPKEYWADEVRLPTSPKPKYLYASTRGLNSETKGYVAVYKMNADGMVEGDALSIWETPTSGGIANAIEPAPHSGQHGDVEVLAMTDSEEAWVFVLSFDGRKVQEVARLALGKTAEEKNVQAATAVWL